MAITLQVKIEKFNKAMEEIYQKAKMGGVSKQKIVDAETVKILEIAIKRTDTATEQTILKSINSRPPWRTYDGKKYKLTNRYPQRIAEMIATRLAESFERKLAAISLSRRVWYEAGKQVAGDVSADSKTKNAVAKGVDVSTNATVRREGNEDSYGIAITNSSPLIRWSESRRAIYGAITFRQNFFMKNLANGIFNSMKAISLKYPGFEMTFK